MIEEVPTPGPPCSSTPSSIATAPVLSKRRDWSVSVSMNSDQHSIVPVLPARWSKTSSTQSPLLPPVLALNTLSGTASESCGRNAPTYGDVPVSIDEGAESSNVVRSPSLQLVPRPGPVVASFVNRY